VAADVSAVRQRILITGGSGLLALGWAATMRDEADIVLGLHRHAVRFAKVEATRIDLEDTDALARTMEKVAPTLVVHAAGLTSVDQCEREPDLARHVNVELAENVAMVSARLDVPLIHISTDHLFSGQQQRVSEGEPVMPVNVYGRTKLEAEQCVMAVHPTALAVRTNFFGWGSSARRSFSDWIIDSLGAKQPITLFDDAFFTPILIEPMAKASLAIHRLGQRGPVNVCGDERISKYDFGLRLARRFELDERLIQRGKLSCSNLAAPRPGDMSLSNRLAADLLGRGLGSLDDYFDKLAQQRSAGLAQELFNAVTE
jgi:dTDP-4-dehydrorhamnose reductase